MGRGALAPRPPDRRPARRLGTPRGPCGGLRQLGREAERQAELARAIELGADRWLVLQWAEQLARAGRWGEAARLLARCSRENPHDADLNWARAITCLRAGDQPGYREARSAIVARLGPNPKPLPEVLFTAQAMALGIGDPDRSRHHGPA